MVLDWPQRNGIKPVTTALNQAIFKAAALALSKELPDETQAFCSTIDQCKKERWRNDYISIMEQFVRLQAKASHHAIIESCQAGLDFAMKSFVMRDNNNVPDLTVSVEQALSNSTSTTQPLLSTETLTGTIRHDDTSQNTHLFHLASPHGTDTNPIWITGQDAINQITTWEKYGCMEPSAAEHAIATCSSDSNITDYVSNKIFCLLGITSEMGPTTHLLKIPGAHVMGVARTGSKLDILKDWFRSNSPVDTQLDLCAADLLNDTISIAQWIVDTTASKSDQHLVIMPLAYMDGEANVRVTVAMDVIITYVLRHRSNVSLVYLTSPTTIYTIPKAASIDAKQRYDSTKSTWSNQFLSLASFGSWLQPSDSWKQFDGIVEDGDVEGSSTNKESSVIIYNGAYHLQGPNYCLAKIMQQWRCMVANADPKVVSVFAPHAPGTRTWSVRHNPQAAVAIEGLQYFPPMLTFDVLPCSSLLTAIILHQLKNGRVSSTIQNQHPMELFWDGAVHGGGWRCPYSTDSILALTYILGKTWAKTGWCPPDSLAPKPQI